MKQIHFSVFNEPSAVDEVLKAFNQKRSAIAQVHGISWDHQKDEMTAMALHGKSVFDVSQVGGPLVNDLVAMNALRPFTSSEITALGGVSAFSPIAWKNSRHTLDGSVFAIPWIIDSRAIYYWRDMLDKAGIEEATAFTSFENMEQTFRRLQASGVESPWALALSGGPLIQPACTWIWGVGGDIVSEERVLKILDPKTLLGLRNFFDLYRYMPKSNQLLDFSYTYYELFALRQTAATMGSLAPFLSIKKKLPPDLQAQLGVALAPGPFFIGSSSLVIWKNTRAAADAFALIQYLMSEEVQENYCTLGGYLPARLSVLAGPKYASDPHLSVFAQSAIQGRVFANTKLSGLFEELLSAAIKRIWLKIIANPEIELEATILEELQPIARRASLWGEHL
jgi:multiple sugar transport system substrate-binding protein